MAKLLSLKSINFESNKAEILTSSTIELNKVVDYMKEFTSVIIEIRSHTDSRGSDAYNMKLSQKRATATANYIVSKGIDSKRVLFKGFGETRLLNECKNGVKCDNNKHRINRRSEFIVIDR